MKNRTYIFLTILLLVCFGIFISYAGVKIYEFYVQTEVPTEAVVRAGYQRFRKAVNGFNFKYPIGWKYTPEVSLDDFINGTLVDASGVPQIYLEAPYIGHEFLLKSIGNQEYFFETPTGTDRYYPVSVVSTTMYQTNEPESPMILSVYTRCQIVVSSTQCQSFGDPIFATAHWDRGARPIGGSLSVDRPSSDSGIFYTKLPKDPIAQENTMRMFNQVVETLRFNEIGEWSAFNEDKLFSYHDAKYNYSFIYPANFTLQTNSDLSFLMMTTGTLLNYPQTMTTGTNLSEAKILFGQLAPDVKQKDCLLEEGLSTAPEVSEVNGIKYLKSVGAGAGAGNRYDTVTYATRFNNECINITLFLHSTVLENYPEELRPKEFDKEQITAAFYHILNSILLK